MSGRERDDFYILSLNEAVFERAGPKHCGCTSLDKINSGNILARQKGPLKVTILTDLAQSAFWSNDAMRRLRQKGPLNGTGFLLPHRKWGKLILIKVEHNVLGEHEHASIFYGQIWRNLSRKPFFPFFFPQTRKPTTHVKVHVTQVQMNWHWYTYWHKQGLEHGPGSIAASSAQYNWRLGIFFFCAAVTANVSLSVTVTLNRASY